MVVYYPALLAASLRLYDLFQTGYISAGLLAEGIFHTGQAGIFGIADQGGLRLRHLYGAVYRRQSAGAAGGTNWAAA